MKKDSNLHGFAECDAFQKGLKHSFGLILNDPNFKLKLFRHYTNQNVFMIRIGLIYCRIFINTIILKVLNRLSMKQNYADKYSIFDIFYNNTKGDNFENSSLAKKRLIILPGGDGVSLPTGIILNGKKYIFNGNNMAKYLFDTVDQNICLYQGYLISTDFMIDTYIEYFNLQFVIFGINLENEYPCWNSLRFTNLTNPTKILGIDNHVNCKL